MSGRTILAWGTALLALVAGAYGFVSGTLLKTRIAGAESNIALSCHENAQKSSVVTTDNPNKFMFISCGGFLD